MSSRSAILPVTRAVVVFPVARSSMTISVSRGNALDTANMPASNAASPRWTAALPSQKLSA